MVPESWERHISQVESDEFGEYLVRELTIYCPYCATQLAHDGIWELTDYNVEMPPRQNTLRAYWVCGNCLRSFRTEHTLNADGYLKEEEGMV